MQKLVLRKELEEYKSIRRLLALDLSKSTQENYLRDIKKFMDYSKIENLDVFLGLSTGICQSRTLAKSIRQEFS